MSLVFLAFLSGCSESSFARAHATEVFQQAPDNAVDILWVVDNSSSMDNEQASVAAGAQSFADRLVMTDIDFHLGLITTDVSTENPDAGALIGNPSVLTLDTPDYVQQFQERVLVGVDGDDQERGLQAALYALTPPLSNTRNVGFLREEALLSIFILSDENDCSDFGALGADSDGHDCYDRDEELTPISEVVRQFRALKEDEDRVVMSGIVGPDASEGCTESVPGKRYASAIGSLGGLNGSICNTDYAFMMDSLGEIATGMLTSFTLDRVPDAASIEVTVQDPEGKAHAVAADASNGWSYNNDPQAPVVAFHGTEVPPRGSEITIEYVIMSEIVDAEE